MMFSYSLAAAAAAWADMARKYNLKGVKRFKGLDEVEDGASRNAREADVRGVEVEVGRRNLRDMGASSQGLIYFGVYIYKVEACGCSSGEFPVS